MFPAKQDSDKSRVPFVSFTGRDPNLKSYPRGGKVFPPAQEFGKRSDVFQILMPTAPTRIKSIPPAQPRITLSPRFTLIRGAC